MKEEKGKRTVRIRESAQNRKSSFSSNYLRRHADAFSYGSSYVRLEWAGGALEGFRYLSQKLAGTGGDVNQGESKT